MNCRNCDGEGGARIVEGKSVRYDCGDCLAEASIVDGKYEDNNAIYEVKGHKMGFTDLEGAKKLCECFRQGHPGRDKIKKPENSEDFDRNMEKLKKFKTKEIEVQTDVQAKLLDNYERHKNKELYDYKRDPSKFPKIPREIEKDE